MGTDIDLQVNHKQASAYLADGRGPGILVLHAWWGLKPFFKQFCDRLAGQGYTVLAPDLYQARIAATVEEAKALMEQRDSEFMGNTVKAAKDYLTSLRAGKPIGVTGFSMGASWTLVLAANEPDIAAAVLYYGSGGVDFSQIKACILGHYAEEDEWEPLDEVKMMEADMQAAGVNATFHIYPKVGHWFVEEDRPEYDSEAAHLAWERTVEFLKANLA